ncbi:MAG: exopolyphosphatase [Desulfobacterales bacterium]|nr:MAG: exopolyphosphatase [Desulfobacterales bacterium]
MRIVTRPDFDGVVCAVLLCEALDVKEPVKWVEPSEIQRGLVDIRQGDIITNLPYDERGTLWFDHHYTNRTDKPFQGSFQIAPSAAGIIYRHYQDRLHRDYHELVQAADKIDAADLTLDEVLRPEKHDYVLLSLTISKDIQPDVSYWNKLVDLLRKFEIQKVLEDAEVKQRCQAVIEQNARYADFLKDNTRLVQHVSVTDLRAFDPPPVGNRFLVYSLYPEAVVNVRIRYEDPRQETITLNVGHSIFNPHCNVNAGLMLSRYGGGGHRAAGACRFPAHKGDEYIPQIIDILVKNENNEN